MNLIEKAQKVMLFKANIAKECKKRNMRMPSDDKISEYINGGYSMELKAFMDDYTHFEGVFRQPKRELRPFELATLNTTLAKLTDAELAVLYNVFIEDIGAENGSVFDLANGGQVKYIEQTYGIGVMRRLSPMVTNGHIRFVHIYNDGVKIEITAIEEGIKEWIKGYWGEIFDRLMMFPEVYEYDYKEGASYFTTIIAPIMVKFLGYAIDWQKNEVTYKGDK